MINTKSQWRKAVLPSNATLQDVITSMNKSSLKIVMISNKHGKLEGTVSDGDIRRGLLKGLSLGSSIESVIHRKALVVPPSMSRDMVLQLMIANKIQQIPVVDDKQCVLGLHVWDEISTSPKFRNRMVIMAGGKGTRLRPLTENCPKPLLTIAGRPILEHIIERAKLEGFSEFVLAVNYLGHLIEDYFGNGDKLGVNISYLRETVPLGTAGALSMLHPRPKDPIVVINGDVVTDIRYYDLLDFHSRQEAAATMAVLSHEWQHPFGVVQTRGVDIVGFEEKPISRSYINAGVYVLSPHALDELEEGAACDIPILFERLQAREFKIVAYPMHEPWLDIGRPDDLKKAHDAARGGPQKSRNLK